MANDSGEKAVPELRVIRNAKGLYQRGSAGGPGRRALPEWLHSYEEDLLHLQVKAALDGFMPSRDPRDEEGRTEWIPVSEKTRAMVLDSLLDRCLGKPVSIEQTPDDTKTAIQAVLAALTGGKVAAK